MLLGSGRDHDDPVPDDRHVPNMAMHCDGIVGAMGVAEQRWLARPHRPGHASRRIEKRFQIRVWRAMPLVHELKRSEEILQHPLIHLSSKQRRCLATVSEEWRCYEGPTAVKRSAEPRREQEARNTCYKSNFPYMYT